MDKIVIRENNQYIFYNDCIYSKQCYKYLIVRESKKWGKYSLHRWIDDNDVPYNKQKGCAIFCFKK